MDVGLMLNANNLSVKQRCQLRSEKVKRESRAGQGLRGSFQFSEYAGTPRPPMGTGMA
jgi:hypothetical protein